MARHCDTLRPSASLKIRWAYGTGPAQKALSTQNSLLKHSETQEHGPRQRKTHHKVRTGCLTCKFRRKKCDETKPACKRCTSTGRNCEGYSELQSTSNASSQLLNESSLSACVSSETSPISNTASDAASVNSPRQQHLSRPPNYFAALGPVTDLDRYCFAYFYCCTFPQITSYFDAPLWRTNLICGMQNPVVFSAVVALGAVHRRFSYGISREAFEFCAHADRLHKKAVHQLAVWKEQNNHSDAPYHHKTSMMVEMLLSMFESFQGEHAASVEHTKSAVHHLIQGGLLKLMRIEKRHCNVKSRSRVFCKLLYRLYCQLSELFDTPIKILVKSANSQSLPPVPHKFECLEDARDYLFTEIDCIVHSSARWRDELSGRSRAQNMHAARLVEWGYAYTRLTLTMSRTLRQQEACAFLKLTRNAAYLLSFVIFFANVEIHEPVPLPRFDPDPDDAIEPKITTATDFLWTAATNFKALDVNLGGVKLEIEALLDDDIVWHKHETEHEIRDIDSMSKPNSYYCKAPQVGIYSISDRISSDGDVALLSALRIIWPRSFDTEWTDVSCMLEDQVLLVRYHTPCEDGIGYWYTQEWWKL